MASKRNRTQEYARQKYPAGGGAPHEQNGEDVRGLATTCLDTIKPRPLRWLVPGYIPRGKLVLLVGDGGEGKSTQTLNLAACVSRGWSWMTNLPHLVSEPAGVLLVSCEDDFADTIVPRLIVAGADLSRIWQVDGIETKKTKDGKDGKPAPFCLAYYEAVEQELKRRKGISLVIIDPAGAYIGRSGIDDHKDAELRSLLGPMSEMAARCDTTIVLVKHFSKAANVKAAHRVTGSVGYINTVRAAFALVPDPDDAERKLFLPLKFNIARKPPGQAFRLKSLDVVEREQALKNFDKLSDEDREQMGEQLFRIFWEGEVATDVDAVLARAAKQEREPNKVEACLEWLKEFLKD
jgi:RecA-family ATPase